MMTLQIHHDSTPPQKHQTQPPKATMKCPNCGESLNDKGFRSHITRKVACKDYINRQRNYCQPAKAQPKDGNHLTPSYQQPIPPPPTSPSQEWDFHLSFERHSPSKPLPPPQKTATATDAEIQTGPPLRQQKMHLDSDRVRFGHSTF